MKKKHLIIIISQSVVIILLAMYGFVQSTVAKVAHREVEFQMKKAMEYKSQAEQASAEAVRQSEIARVNALRQAALADEMVKKALKKK
jgi:flagellar basal body-associated protein FliL